MYSAILLHSLLPGFVLPMKNVFGLQRVPQKPSMGGIVVTVALAAHGGTHPELDQ